MLPGHWLSFGRLFFISLVDAHSLPGAKRLAPRPWRWRALRSDFGRHCLRLAQTAKDHLGECWDNAAMESFFSSMKTERLSRKVYRTREEARSDVFDYIERFYNPVRKHSKLDFLSPVNFEH